MIVVGLSGKARTGKSHLTRELFSAAEKLGWNVEVMPFAGPLKREAAANGYGKDVNPEKYRAYCQEQGATMRAEDPDHWVKLWFKDIEKLAKYEKEMDNPLLVLVDDCRYKNEIKILNDYGGVVTFVKHGKREIEDPNGKWRKHESEAIANFLETLPDIDIKRAGYDYIIHNDGEADGLAKWAANFINKVCTSEDCPCEACTSTIENRKADPGIIDNELRKLLDQIEDLPDDDEDH